MSLAVQNVSSTSSTAIAAADAGRDRRSPPARVDDGDRAAPNGRHALVAAIADAVEALVPGGADNAPPAGGHASKHALHGFLHALFAELRPAAGEGGQGRGFAWGRTSAATLAERLDDLVARLQAGSTTTTTSAAATGEETSPATAPVEETSPATEPAAPAPASPLLTAFGKLATARGAGGVDSATSDALIAMLQRVASALGGDAGAVAPATGGLLDATA